MHRKHPLQRDPDRGELRQFGLGVGVLVLLVFGALLPWLFDRAWPRWPWVVAAIFATWSLVAPATLAFLYRGWARIGLAIGRVTTPLVLGVVFFLVIVPVGLVRRLFAADVLARKWDETATSYRVPAKARDADDLSRPF